MALEQSDIATFRQIIREELQSLLGLGSTNVEKLADRPLEERKAYAKARRLEQKRKGK